MGLKEWIIPQDKLFFEALDNASANAVAAADALQELFDTWTHLEDRRQGIKDLEHKGDAITHGIFDHLGRSFITPLDREDISALAKAFDDVVDFIYACSNRLFLYKIPAATPAMKKFAEHLRAQTRELQSALKEIRRPHTQQGAFKHCVEVNRIENLADRLLNDAVADLFTGQDPIFIMKQKEIYEILETATDKCEDAADVIADVVRKHS